MKMYTWKNKRLEFISCIILILIWQLVAVKINNEVYIPRIEDVLLALLKILKDKDFWMNIFSSLYRSILSFILAYILAVLFGVISLICPIFKSFIKPINSIGKTIPTMVLVVLSLIWFDKDKTPYVVGFSIVFPILYEGVVNSILDIDSKIIEMCNIYNVTLKQKVRKLYIPSIMFYTLGILVSTFSLAFKVVIAGEVHGQPRYGIGSAIQLEKMNFNTTAIFAWIIIIGIVSIIFEKVNQLISKRLYRWKNENRN
ncbi:MAG: ABC transporter permease subunit [Clostridium sp.]|nr:ABC transporter permease subunit [Clostridium sp.]